MAPTRVGASSGPTVRFGLTIAGPLGMGTHRPLGVPP
jgi:hypothetical protein